MPAKRGSAGACFDSRVPSAKIPLARSASFGNVCVDVNWQDSNSADSIRSDLTSATSLALRLPSSSSWTEDQHAEQSDYDMRRDTFLRSHGFRVLRFWNNDVLNRTEIVLETIYEALWRTEMDGRFD